MKLVMKKSAFIELAKALNGDSFEKIKADIITHLKNLEKKENQSDLKKAIEHFNELERYPHLEKSVTGELIEKAVYGIGTVREWKGKKYKKIAQGKWVRVYDKVDRGAKNAMTRLVHQAEKINTPEEMLQFVLANKQRFVDERTGSPLDIVDRLNAVIDKKEYKTENAEKKQTSTPKEKQEMKNDKKTLDFEINDIGNSKKKVTDLEQAKNIIEIIAKKYGATEEGREKLDSFMSYNIGGTNPIFDKLYTSYGVSAGDLDDDYEAAFDMVLKNALGKDTSKERKKIDTAFATQSAKARKNLLDNDKKFLQELKKEKAGNKKKTANTDVFSPSDSADIDSKQVIAEPVSQEKDRVEFPGTKEIKNEFEQLKRSCSTNPHRSFMNHVYYDKPSGVLVATDARILKFIKVGDLKGFEDSQFVAVDTKGKNVVLTPQEVDGAFPHYKKVIPDKTAGKVKLDNKALVKKLKEMKADGAISKKNPSVDFELQKNGDVLVDGTKIGTVSGRDIKEGDFFRLDSTYILNAISGDSSELNFSKEWGAGVTNDYERAMTINTGCSTNVIMPQTASERINYQQGRDEKKAKNDKKNAAMEERVKSNERYVEIAKDSRELQPEKILEVMQRIPAFNDEDLIRQWKIANADLNSLGKKYDFDKDQNKRIKETGTTVYNTIETVLLLEKYPKIKSALEKEIQKRGLSTQIKKSTDSLFDYIQKSIGILKDCHAI